MNKDEKREMRRKRLMDSKAYQAMSSLTRYMDRYYLDKNPDGYCHLPLSLFEFAKKAKENKTIG